MSDPVARIAGRLAQAAGAGKCHTCGCFQDAVSALRQSNLAQVLSEVLESAAATFADRQYDCLGCDVCWPADALNVASGVVELPSEVARQCDAKPAREGWPVFPGEYRVARYAAPVAVCTLHSRELVGEVFEAAPEGLSIVGSLQTENLGIERILANVAANPNIRFLVLCGEDTPGRVGHFPGQSLLALARHGVDDEGRIVGAKGIRPVIKNVDLDLVTHFRETVEVAGFRGLVDVREIAVLVADCAARDPGAVEIAPTPVRKVRVLRAEPRGPLILDPAGYVVIAADRRRDLIVVEHYDNEGVLQTVVEGESAVDLAATLIREELVSRSDHAAYVGRELTRAEGALRDGEPYVQGGAPRDPA